MMLRLLDCDPTKTVPAAMMARLHLEAAERLRDVSGSRLEAAEHFMALAESHGYTPPAGWAERVEALKGARE